MRQRAMIAAVMAGSVILTGLVGCNAEAPVAGGEVAKAEAGVVWGTDFAKAQAESKASGKPILAFFTGSDWCGWCIRLHKEVLGEKAFADYATKNLVLFEADFPRRKQLDAAVAKQNQELMEKYGVQGFPTLYLLDAEGKVLGMTGYQRGGAEKYVEHLQELVAKKGK